MAHKVTRRELLKWSAVAAAGSTLAACAPPAQVAPTAVPATAVPPTEAPKAAATEAPKTVAPTTAAAPAGKAPVQISMIEMIWGVPQDKVILDRVAKALSKRAQDDGVAVEFQSILLDDRTNQYPMLYAAGEKFTFAFDAPWLVMNSLIDQGYLVALEELLPQYAPNIMKITGDDITKANFIKDHLYGIVAWFYFGQTSGCIIREDLRLKYGVPEIGDNWASLEPFLAAIKKNEPNMIPFSMLKSGAIAFGQGDQFYNAFDAPLYDPGNKLKGACIPDLWKETKYQDTEDQDTFKRYAEISYKWWQEGYLGELAQGVTSLQAINNGLVAAFSENEPDFKYSQYQVQVTLQGAQMRGYDMSGQHSGRIKKDRRNKQWNYIVFNKAAPEESVIAGLEFFNWIYADQANMDLWLFGEDGVDHKMEANMRYTTVPGTDTRYRRNWFVGGVPGKLERIPADTPDVAKGTLDFLSNPENFLLNPIEGFDPDNKPVETQLAAYEAAYNEARYPIVSGEQPTADALANWKKVLDDAGRQKLKAEFQKQLDDWIAAHK